MNTTVAARSGPATAWHAGSTKALGLLVAGVLLSIWAVATDARLAYILVYAWFGVGYGLLLQYGRFCMASAVRDLFAVRVPRMAVGMMIAVGLYALVSAVVTLAGFSGFHPNPMGWHVLIGAAIFGFGIVFSPAGVGSERRTHAFTEFGAGVIDTFPLPLSELELQQLHRSASILRKALDELENGA